MAIEINLYFSDISARSWSCLCRTKHLFQQRMTYPMHDVRTSRPFQERFLDGYNRSQLRRDVENVKPQQSGSLQRKSATMALGFSLALGIFPVPLNFYRSIGGDACRNTSVPQLASGLQTAKVVAVRLERYLARSTATVSDPIKADFFLKHVPFGSIIYKEAKKNNVSPELVAAVARAESSFHPTARSQRGAIGVMQLVPRTGRWLGATDLTDPTQNIVAGAKYLGYLSDRFGGNEDHVIAAYNAGEGNIRRFDGVPPFRETRDYVERVHRFQRDLRARMEGQVSDLGIGWSGPASYRERFDVKPERSRSKINIHWTAPEERRAQKQRS
jgi:soluble lytic murein transglycosylase-like protein